MTSVVNTIRPLPPHHHVPFYSIILLCSCPPPPPPPPPPWLPCALGAAPSGLQGVCERVHVCGSVNMHMQCVCVACGVCVGGDCGACGWAMGEWWLAPHTPTMAICIMHWWGWVVAAVASAVGVCGCVGVVQRRVLGCGAAAQAHLEPAASARPGFAPTGIRSPTRKPHLQTPQ